MVTYTGVLPADKMFILLYAEAHGDWIRGVSPLSDGSYTIDKTPAAIDTNGDKKA
ncbi:MAG: hypothetical protein JW863_08660 [Chitinispirillaceae bacterium]|nr:hypothetical protein [Chitinispirillaceae bacterium]